MSFWAKCEKKASIFSISNGFNTECVPLLFSSAFRNLRNDPDFCDVRLAVRDRSRPLKAHKVVLSSCSPYFSSLLREMNSEQNSLSSTTPFYIMMRGVSHSQLSGILDFMYYGEANVAQEDLDPFLALAEELQVRVVFSLLYGPVHISLC